ncbi:MAG: acyl-CoA synthetase [Candidatus Binataceae bacterium]
MEADELESRPFLSIPEHLNIAHAIVDRHVAAGRGGKIAAWAGDRGYTYAELRDLSNRFGNVLRGLGVGRGDRVLLRLGTNMYSMIAILGAIKIGAVIIPSNFLFRDHEVEKILHNSEAIIAVSTAELAGPIEAVRGRGLALKQVIIAGGTGELSWDRLMENASAELVCERTFANELAFIIYTSGTTGDPKGVEQAHRWIIGAGDPVNHLMVRLRPDDICYQPQDWSFMYPLGSSFFFPLFFGATIVLHEGRFEAEAALRTIERRAVTIFHGVPTIYRMMAAVPGAESRFNLRSLRMGVSAGEALPADTFRDWRERLGVTVHDGIGQTECHIFIANKLGARIKPGSMGRPLPGYEVAVLDDSGAPAKPGEPGHLVFRNDSAGLALGYRNDAERWAAVNRGGWYYTKDITYVDDEGYYWYVSRSDDLIKSRAYLISPKEVESALLEHPAVLEAAVVGIETAAGEHRVKAYLTLKPGNQANDALVHDIKAHVRGVIALYKVPQDIEFAAELPKTANGKILRRELRARA